MNILLFGATGMVGQGVLRECLLDPGVLLVQAVGRSATGVQHRNCAKLYTTIFATMRPLRLAFQHLTRASSASV
jgi:uncharacterized protein YbjT (DUF2867 family)